MYVSHILNVSSCFIYYYGIRKYNIITRWISSLISSLVNSQLQFILYMCKNVSIMFYSFTDMLQLLKFFFFLSTCPRSLCLQLPFCLFYFYCTIDTLWGENLSSLFCSIIIIIYPSLLCNICITMYYIIYIFFFQFFTLCVAIKIESFSSSTYLYCFHIKSLSDIII